MREIKFEIKFENLRDYINKHSNDRYYKTIYTLDELLDRNGCCYNPQVEKIIYKRMFTGLHDKNGKEIYEGDIVKNINPKSDAYNNTSEVVYHKAIGGFVVLFENIGQDKMLGGYEHLEIIGNIYENPELLGE